MENIDRGWAADCFWQSVFDEVVTPVYEVGAVTLAPFAAVMLLLGYIRVMRVVGIFSSDVEEAATVTAPTAARNGRDNGDNSNDSTSINDEGEENREDLENALQACFRLCVLRWSVDCSVWVAQKAASAATGEELVLPFYVLVVASLISIFACELLPQLGPWHKILVTAFSLVLQCLLALLGGLVTRAQRMLCVAACAVGRTMLNTLCAVGNLLWRAGKSIWTELCFTLCTAERGIVDAAGTLQANVSQRSEATGRDSVDYEEPPLASVPVRIIDASQRIDKYSRE